MNQMRSFSKPHLKPDSDGQHCYVVVGGFAKVFSSDPRGLSKDWPLHMRLMARKAAHEHSWLWSRVNGSN